MTLLDTNIVLNVTIITKIIILKVISDLTYTNLN